MMSLIPIFKCTVLRYRLSTPSVIRLLILYESCSWYVWIMFSQSGEYSLSLATG